MASLVPFMAERVTVHGHDGAFFVVKVDHDACTVDLIPIFGFGCTLADVLFSELMRGTEVSRDTTQPATTLSW